MAKKTRDHTLPPPTQAQTPVSPVADQRRQEMLAVVLVLLVAALIRVAYFLQYQARVPYYSATILDSGYYDAWAWRVAQGHGYGPMPFYMAPLYPYVLASVYLIAGHSLTAVYALQSILGLANLLLTYVLARRLFGHRAGLVAMLLMTVYAPLVYLETKLLTETLALALNLVSLLLLMRAMSRPAILRFAAAGIVLGLSAVCRPSALVTVALIFVWLLAMGLRSRASSPTGVALKHTAFLAIGVMLAILPVTARNYFVGHDIALLSTNGGIVFAQANHPGTNGISSAMDGFTGSIMTQQDEEMVIARKALGHPVTPSESSSFWLNTGLCFIRSQPVEFAKLLGRKLVWSLHSTEADCSYNVYLEQTLVPVLRLLALPFSLLAGLSLFGFIASRKSANPGESALLGIYTASVYLGLIVFSVTSRYRVPAIPAMCVFAGYGLTRCLDAVSARRVREVVVGLGCIAAFLVVSLVKYPIPKITATSLANLGTSYVAAGRTAEGISALERSLRTDPGQSSVEQNLGTALMIADKTDSAIEHFSRALKIGPERAQIHNNLGFALLRQRDGSRAESEFRKAIGLTPDFAEAHAGLANALGMEGRSSEAAGERAIANHLKPDLARAHFDVANTLQSQGNVDEAVRQYKEAIRLQPDFADAYVNLGLVFKERNDLPEAVLQYREAIRIQPGSVRAHNNLAIALYYQGKYADAWKEVHASQKHGGQPHPGFLQALSNKLPDPGR